MGTRNLTIAIMDGKTRVAQYGQWDGYPEGQGTTILEFLKSADLDLFKKKLETTAFIDDEKQEEIDKWLEKIGCKDGWMNMEQSKKYQKKYPLLTRDNGGSIFELIYESKDSINWINNSEDFVGDGLFCEWAYVVDMDKRTFEVYKGFNQEPLTENDRFYKFTEPGDYHPAKLLISFDLDKLPDNEVFVQMCNQRIPVED